MTTKKPSRLTDTVKVGRKDRRPNDPSPRKKDEGGKAQAENRSWLPGDQGQGGEGLSKGYGGSGWCEDAAMTSLIEATRLRLAAWAATVARIRSLADLQETTSELEQGWAYIFDILGSATPVWRKAGYRLDEVVLWNAFADVLAALATVKRCTFGWRLQGSTKPVLQPMPEPGPIALSELAPANAHYRAMLEEWDALRPRLRAVTRRTLAA
jgi:hypothetical protein